MLFVVDEDCSEEKCLRSVLGLIPEGEVIAKPTMHTPTTVLHRPPICVYVGGAFLIRFGCAGDVEFFAVAITKSMWQVPVANG